MSVVSYEKHGAAAVVTISNPPLNVMNQQVTRELKEVFGSLKEDNETLAVILTGAGDRAFMAGADIKEFPNLIGKKGIKSNFLEGHAFLNEIEQFPKPVIAVLNGMTFGGGCELALTCDLRIAEEHAQVGLPEIKLGLFPGGGGTQRLPRAVGAAKAKELMFTGDPIDAAEAKRIGLVSYVLPKGEGLQKALELAGRMTRHSLPALSKIKKAVDEGMSSTLEEGLDLEAGLFEEVFQTEDIKEGVQAFIEKRKPAFSHK